MKIFDFVYNMSRTEWLLIAVGLLLVSIGQKLDRVMLLLEIQIIAARPPFGLVV
jgi:hypothetical protein